jgi:hypothetical protein
MLNRAESHSRSILIRAELKARFVGRIPAEAEVLASTIYAFDW